MTRILTVLTPRVRKMHFRVRCINLHVKCPSFSSRYLTACVVSLRQLWGENGMSALRLSHGKSDIVMSTVDLNSERNPVCLTHIPQ